jgi:hypothetical protein
LKIESRSAILNAVYCHIGILPRFGRGGHSPIYKGGFIV